jgi:hypothetical protein
MTCEQDEEPQTLEEQQHLLEQAQELLERAGYNMVLVIASGEDGTSINALPEMSLFEILGVIDFLSQSLRSQSRVQESPIQSGAVH